MQSSQQKGLAKGLMISAVVTAALLSGCSSNTATEQAAQQKSRLAVETITQKGKYGTIQEERVRALNSETRFIPNGSKEGYALIDPSLPDPKENAHRDPEEMMIPSVTIGRW